MASVKPKLKYHLIEGLNPKSKAKLLRPVIAERETLYIDQLVEYALKSGFVRGQFHDQRGALNGFIEAIQELVRNGGAAVKQRRGVGGAEPTGSLRAFSRGTPARLTRGKVRFLAFADRIRVCAIY